jgi:hypothetical protein
MAATDAASELLTVSILPIRFVAHPCLPRSQGQLLVYTDLQSALAACGAFTIGCLAIRVSGKVSAGKLSIDVRRRNYRDLECEERIEK